MFLEQIFLPDSAQAPFPTAVRLEFMVRDQPQDGLLLLRRPKENQAAIRPGIELERVEGIIETFQYIKDDPLRAAGYTREMLQKKKPHIDIDSLEAGATATLNMLLGYRAAKVARLSNGEAELALFLPPSPR